METSCFVLRPVVLVGPEAEARPVRCLSVLPGSGNPFRPVEAACPSSRLRRLLSLTDEGYDGERCMDPAQDWTELMADVLIRVAGQVCDT